MKIYTHTWKTTENIAAFDTVSQKYSALLPDLNFYTGKAFDFPRLFLVYRSQPLFCTLPVQRPY